MIHSLSRRLLAFTMTSVPIHTYGPTCLLADDDADPSSWYTLERPPNVRPQFFYISSLPIDDPLTALPPPTSGQGPANERAPPQPFSIKDNITLEEAWQSIRRTRLQRGVRNIPSREGTPARNVGISVPGRASATGTQGGPSRTGSQRSPTSVPAMSPDEPTSQYVPSSSDKQRRQSPTVSPLSYRKRDISPTSSPKTVKRRVSGTPQSDDAITEGAESTSPKMYPSRDGSISGSPFARVPGPHPRSPLGRSVESVSSMDGHQEAHPELPSSVTSHMASKPSGLRTSIHQDEPSEDSKKPLEDPLPEEAQEKVPVGVSRLHLVELPNLKVCPVVACTP